MNNHENDFFVGGFRFFPMVYMENGVFGGGPVGLEKSSILKKNSEVGWWSGTVQIYGLSSIFGVISPVPVLGPSFSKPLVCLGLLITRPNRFHEPSIFFFVPLLYHDISR